MASLEDALESFIQRLTDLEAEAAAQRSRVELLERNCRALLVDAIRAAAFASKYHATVSVFVGEHRFPLTFHRSRPLDIHNKGRYEAQLALPPQTTTTLVLDEQDPVRAVHALCQTCLERGWRPTWGKIRFVTAFVH